MTPARTAIVLTTRLESCEQLVVLGVRTNPEPDGRIPFDSSDCLVAQSDTRRAIHIGPLQALESKAGMKRILDKQDVGIARLQSNVGRQSPQQRTELCS